MLRYGYFDSEIIGTDPEECRYSTGQKHPTSFDYYLQSLLVMVSLLSRGIAFKCWHRKA